MIATRKLVNRFAMAASLIAISTPSILADSYETHNLVSSGIPAADHTDTNLVNGWGLVLNPDGFWWLSSNGTGLSTLYNDDGVPQSLVVTIPAPPGSSDPAAPTGIVLNQSNDFVVGSGLLKGPASFIYATEDGTIVGWSAVASLTNGIIAVDNSSQGAIYKGLALVDTSSGRRLYVADFHNNRVDVFDSSFKPVTLAAGAFTDPALPAGFAPYNVALIDSSIFIPYGKQDEDAKDDVAGTGNGFVDEFDTDGTLVRRFASTGTLSSPFGVVVAPDDFGPFSGALLVGNFGDGRINAYDRTSATFLGQLKDADDTPLEVNGLWGLSFGLGEHANVLFFAAGPDGESNGLFGKITVVKSTPAPPPQARKSLCGLGSTMSLAMTLLGLMFMRLPAGKKRRRSRPTPMHQG